MDYYLFIILIIFGSINAFLSSTILYVTFDAITKFTQKKPQMGESLQRLKDDFEDNINPLFIIEFVSYGIAGMMLAYYLIRMNYDFWYSVLITFSAILAALLARTLLFALGGRLASKISPLAFPLIALLMLFSKPIVWIIKKLNNSIIGKSTSEATREEITALLDTSHEEGSLETGEYRILKNMMKFSSILVSDVMTPRTVIFHLSSDKSVGEIVDLPELKMYSRFPIWSGDSLDHGVTGYVLSRDIFIAALHGETDKKLSEFAREVYFIPENVELDNALDKFLQRRQHLFVVVDEYGGVEGLLTMEDVLETILGVEIVDEADKVIDLRLYAKQRRDKRIASILNQS